MAIQIGGTSVINNSRCLINIANATSSAATPNTFVIRDADGKIKANSFDLLVSAATPIGTLIEGGTLICKSSSIAMIVSLSNTEVGRIWNGRGDGVTVANSLSGCTGWFVPTCSQLKNPGYSCSSFWENFKANECYWSSTTNPGATHRAFTGEQSCYKNATRCVRVFRCVTY
jgi:hypothetical protein